MRSPSLFASILFYDLPCPAEASLATSLMIIGAWAGCLVGGPASEVSGDLLEYNAKLFI